MKQQENNQHSRVARMPPFSSGVLKGLSVLAVGGAVGFGVALVAGRWAGLSARLPTVATFVQPGTLLVVFSFAIGGWFIEEVRVPRRPIQNHEERGLTDVRRHRPLLRGLLFALLVLSAVGVGIYMGVHVVTGTDSIR